MTTFTNNGETVILTGKIFYRPGGNALEVIYTDGTFGSEHVEDIICEQGRFFNNIPGDDEKEECWDYAGSNDTYPDLNSALDAFICNTSEA
jgi:hypothetical protein